MGEAQATGPLPNDDDWQPFWLTRAFSGVGLLPTWVGPALGVTALGVFALQELALGRFPLAALPGDPQGVLDGIRVTVTHVVIAAYLVTAAAIAVRVTERTLVRLRPVLISTPETGRSPWERWVLWGFGVLGIGITLLVNATVSPGPISYDPARWSPETGWHRVLAFVLAFWALRLMAVIAIDSLRLTRLARDLRQVDLLDLRPLSPFVTQGLSNVLLVVGFVAVFALFLVDLRYLALFIPTLLMTALAAGVALALPVWGSHKRIQAAKQEELDWCRDRLRAARSALAQGGTETGVDELLAWEARVEQVRAWPFDAAVFARFGLYLLIPLLSWSGGALVERLIDALLD